MDDKLFTEKEVEMWYGLKIGWLRRMRQDRRGIPFLKLGRMVRYRQSAIEAYLESCAVEPGR